MKKKTILITGVSGVIGRRLTERLLDKFKVIALGSEYSRIPENIRYHKNFKFYEKNFLKIQNVSELGIDESVDVILHLAGVVSGSKTSEAEYFKINSESTKILIELAKTKKVKAFGLASSVSVYGYQKIPIQLTSDRLGVSVYARSKIAAENFCLSSPVNYSIFRIASVYGFGSKSFVSKLFILFKKGVYPALKQETQKSILHIEDAVQALLSWIQQVCDGKTTKNVYVLSHPESVSVAKVIAEFRSQNKSRFRGLRLPVLPVLIPIFNVFYHLIRKIQGIPFHESPLDPLLFSIEVHDPDSWQKLGINPKWDLRKGIAEYK